MTPLLLTLNRFQMMFPLLNLNKLVPAEKTICKHSKTKFCFSAKKAAA